MYDAMPTVPRATIGMNGDVVLHFPYNAHLVERLKTIPAYYRSYSPADKSWCIRPSYADVAIDFLRAFFPDARIHDANSRPPEPEPIRRTGQTFALLHLLPSAPGELIEAAYRCLAKLHHPDAGGTHETMREINDAYSTLKAREAVS
jgi:hypothetical protein